MDPTVTVAGVLSFAAIAVFASVGIRMRRRADRAAREAGRDESRRAGETPPDDASTVALRAGGASAWMRGGDAG
ncbi:hypothetical protein ET445_15445 [Agromyces protaetiae]|uniref:Uncharacterized protein n=1 Tax=Agromyces protaetiae TaxID=2509455 RepID=A0A4P6FH71_9MICO|nr:hypothetical protein [Agromyces protaetiae]QAY74513.1 hypothetical protein ET445_15445 [Agromyces protaetiae]